MSEKKFGSLVTKNGIALIADCILNEKKLPITTAAAGDGGGAYYLPDAEQTALKNECWRGEIAGFALNKNTPNMLDVKIIIDDEAGGFTIREMGLFTADGIMFAVCNTPDTEKISNAGIPGKITMVMHIVVADTSAVEIKINPELDTVTPEQLENRIANHNSDPAAHANIINGIIDKLKPAKIPFTLLASGWSEGLYTLTVPGVTAESTQEILPAIDITKEQLAALQSANIQDGGQSENTIVLKAFGDVPAIDIPIIVVMRG